MVNDREKRAIDMFSCASVLEDLVASCKRCSPVDKPLVKHKVYVGWLPDRVKILAVGESPPPGFKEDLFYNLNRFDRLRLSMKHILGIEDDEEVLASLKASSAFITAAVKCRPLSRRELEEMRKNCLYALRQELSLLKPELVVAMGKAAASSVSEVLGIDRPSTLKQVSELRTEGLTVAFTPHPNYIFRFMRGLAPKLRDLLVRYR